MHAAILHAAHDLRLENVDDPPLAADEVRVAFRSGGICGSDLSYYFKGRVGDFALREPLILGHEVSGQVDEVGADVHNVRPGDRVAVNPSRPCLACDYCRAGRGNLCRGMRFFGSAAVFPHVQGAFRERLTVRADQCHVVPPSVSWQAAASAEPLSVGLHAVERAGELLGRTVVVAGAGPIGCMTVLAARAKGAARITVFDRVKEPLAVARACGADEVVDAEKEPDRLDRYREGKGWFDVGFEVTGAPAVVGTLFSIVRPGGRIVQVGMLPPGDAPVPVNKLQSREIDYIGAFRCVGEYATAVAMIASGRIDVAPTLTHDVALVDAGEAFALAADRSRSVKVTVHF
ncbi:MAG TPA: L-idonate 5-dehydrogenase [Burkholderiaceae bacterium]|nr:L-idonate 5-dehydrogenase [Burkholderiaceae bacterium]